MTWTRAKIIEHIESQMQLRGWSLRRIATEVEKRFPAAKERLSYDNLKNFRDGKTQMMRSDKFEQLLAVLPPGDDAPPNNISYPRMLNVNVPRFVECIHCIKDAAADRSIYLTEEEITDFAIEEYNRVTSLIDIGKKDARPSTMTADAIIMSRKSAKQ